MKKIVHYCYKLPINYDKEVKRLVNIQEYIIKFLLLNHKKDARWFYISKNKLEKDLKISNCMKYIKQLDWIEVNEHYCNKNKSFTKSIRYKDWISKINYKTINVPNKVTKMKNIKCNKLLDEINEIVKDVQTENIEFDLKEIEREDLSPIFISSTILEPRTTAAKLRYNRENPNSEQYFISDFEKVEELCKRFDEGKYDGFLGKLNKRLEVLV